MQHLGCEWLIILGFSPVMYPPQSGVGICAVPMTGEISCYNVIIQLRVPGMFTVCGDDQPGILSCLTTS